MEQMTEAVVHSDIEKLRQVAEEGLGRYRLLSEYANDIILFANMNGVIIDANAAAIRAYGYTMQEIQKKSIFELVNPDKRTPVRTQSFDSNASGIYYEALAKRKDGSCFHVEVSMQGAEIGDNKVLMSIQRDITERKRTLKELKKARRRADAANHAKSEFLANMSHEIRTPLNGMLGMIDLTLLTELTAEQKENLNIAKGCANNLLRLINDILDFSRIEANGLSLERLSFNLPEMIEQTLRPHRIKAQQKALLLGTVIDEDIPPIVQGDPVRLQQVLNNLIANALKFTDTGEISISASLVGRTESYAEIEFTVSDTGTGIESTAMERIFDTFSQADNSITRKFGGSGLGLAISKRLIEMMGGSIRAESEKGKGSIFYFTVMLGTEEKTQTIAINTDQSKSKEMHPLRILLAEDELINGIVMARMLKEGGHYVETVNNGTDALKRIYEENPDVVLMDIQMPELDGVEAVRIIRRNEKKTGQHIPVIALTANALQGDREKYLLVGMDGYIPKPVSADILLTTVKEVVEKVKREEGSKRRLEGKKDASAASQHNLLMIENRKTMEQNIKEMAYQLELLREALQERNMLLVEKHAHCIKELTVNAGLSEIKSMIFKLELAARREDIAAADAYLNQFVLAFSQFNNQ